jgi:D-sedoheptulose 7-phosphate isomerase
MNFSTQFLTEAALIAAKIDVMQVEACALLLGTVRNRGGRLFILGVGGSAANASHAVNDFRKIAKFEAYAPTDNVAELSARTNDDGWETVFVQWLAGSRLNEKDCLLILSVGGGSQTTSRNLALAVDYAKEYGASVIGIVGRDGGHTKIHADACVLIPTVNSAHITPHAESFQAVIWHLFVNHPALKL